MAAPVLGPLRAPCRGVRDRLVYRHLNPVRKGLAAKPEDWRWSRYNNFDKASVAACPVQLDDVHFPEAYRG
ncbi:MAG TPA: hypothetical protein VG206_11310 [Terriglobia bacterium]|nr:hypothetical protein [Terriglobia bacterium]